MEPVTIREIRSNLSFRLVTMTGGAHLLEGRGPFLHSFVVLRHRHQSFRTQVGPFALRQQHLRRSGVFRCQLVFRQLRCLEHVEVEVIHHREQDGPVEGDQPPAG